MEANLGFMMLGGWMVGNVSGAWLRCLRQHAGSGGATDMDACGRAMDSIEVRRKNESALGIGARLAGKAIGTHGIKIGITKTK
jgi:hypothetical protein